jgi:hypothetical protein
MDRCLPKNDDQAFSVTANSFGKSCVLSVKILQWKNQNDKNQQIEMRIIFLRIPDEWKSRSWKDAYQWRYLNWVNLPMNSGKKLQTVNMTGSWSEATFWNGNDVESQMILKSCQYFRNAMYYWQEHGSTFQSNIILSWKQIPSDQVTISINSLIKNSRNLKKMVNSTSWSSVSIL